MTMPSFESFIQTATLLVLAITVFISYRQFKAATEQAKSSEAQAKASESMARFSLQQTGLMQAQIHASFRPVITVTGGAYSNNAATLTLENLGTGPALALVAIYRSGVRKSLGSLAPEKRIQFRFENSLNQVPRLNSALESEPELSATARAIPLRLECQSVSGAKCWTTVRFKLGGEGPVDPEIEGGIEFPSLASLQNFAVNSLTAADS